MCILVCSIFVAQNLEITKTKRIKTNLFDMKQKIKNLGEFNAWRGFIGLYLTSKEIRSLKKFGITKDMTLKQAYDKLTK